MDRLESLTNTISNITLYDLKSMYTQAKNVVLNVSEMEAKVREATNDDPWGASSTLMQEIAQGTFHFQHFNEVMPSIYSRFTEKEARQWRQIYKALQLLEYLVKHGSERVVDDARSHISTLKMLRNFHYIDDKGKDEGINVRNRARELVELLSDVEKIRAERRKAKTTKNKYVGVGNEGISFGNFDAISGSRYGGFGNDSLTSSSYGNYGNGGSSSRAGGNSFSDNRRQYEEYNAGDDEIAHTPKRSNSARNPSRKTSVAAAQQPEVDLVGLDDFGPASITNSIEKALPAVAKPISLDDDDFADFQAAPVQTTQAAPPTLTAQTNKPNLMDMLNLVAVPPSATSASSPFVVQQQPMGYSVGVGVGMGGHRQTQSFSSTPIVQTQTVFGGGGAALRPTPVAMGSSFSTPSAATNKPSLTPATKSSSNFDDLWSLSLGSTAAKPSAGGAARGKSMKDLEKEKAMAGLWGGGHQQRPGVGHVATTAMTPQPTAFGSATGETDDLLL